MGKADLHLHTTASDGMMSPAMLMNYIAMCTDLDLVAITDHNTLEGWERASEFAGRRENTHLHRLEVVPGIEVSSRDGHILGIGLKSLVPKGLSALETIGAIREQGGLVLAPHPFARVPGLRDFAGVGKRFLELPFDGVETRNSNATEFLNNFRVARANRHRDRPLAEFGASDAHFLWAVGRTWTDYPGQGYRKLQEAFAGNQTLARGLGWGPVSLFHYFRDRLRWLKFCRNHGVEIDEV